MNPDGQETPHSSDQLTDEILNREAKPLRQIDDSIPRELERICLKCLAKRISERYASAAHLADDLERVVDTQTARQAGPTRTSRWQIAFIGLISLFALVSYDGGKSFEIERTISAEKAAYSDLTVVDNRAAGVLWERGDYRFITFSLFNLEFLERDLSRMR